MYATIIRIRVFKNLKDSEHIIQYLYFDYDQAEREARKIADHRAKVKGQKYWTIEKKNYEGEAIKTWVFDDDVMLTLESDFWLYDIPSGKFYLKGPDFETKVFKDLNEATEYIESTQPRWED